ncbi:MAG: glycosyltransferase family 9 protein [Candidatus Omnitrophica bacterium]|nr:glycosyltransferase family 9 protein [Candidatus Omnitrophota bacterium]
MEPKRILIFELNWLGDILFSLPFLRAIRGRFPDAYITCVVVPRYIDLLVHNPWINDVHALSDNNGISSLGEKLAFINMIRKENYDTCFLLKPSRTKTVMAVLAGITERIGFAGKKTPLTQEVEMPSGNFHRADTILALAGAVGVQEADGTYEYFFSEEDAAHAADIIHKEGKGARAVTNSKEICNRARRIVAVNPGGNWEAKRWPVENFISLAKQILSTFNNVEIMLTGAEKDIPLTLRIVSEVNDSRCYTLAGKTGLNELAALFKKSDVVISADSGPLHLASAAGATTIGVFGPTSHKITGPRGKGRNIVLSKDSECAVPCYIDECDRDYECMKAVTVDEVFRAAEKVLLEGE